MNKQFLFCLALGIASLFADSVFAVQTKALQAAGHYAAKEYDEAAQLYAEIIEQGNVSADLFYNYANTCFNLERYGEAILFYERALVLNPLHEDAQFNLDFVNQRITDKIERMQPFFIISWINALGLLFTTDEWAYGSIALFVVALTGCLLFIFGRYRRLRKAAFVVGIIAVGLSLCAFAFAFAQKNRLEAHTDAIVMVGAVTVKSAPNTDSADLFVLHEGAKIAVIQAVENWSEIRIADGSVGWIKNTSFERI
ncbi:MAG: tetratricopeptide repeat protein [Prevotellaceae bacterium]|nr:tetratricopeptide repeat protein [Prevotellaceae bacterium]